MDLPALSFTAGGALICSGMSSRSKKRRRTWAASHSMFHCASATNFRSDAGRIESITYSGGAGSSGRTTPLKMNPAEMFRRDGDSSVFPSGLGEKHVVAAPLQHLGCSRLAIGAHFNLRCLLLPALIGLLINLSHVHITAVSAGSFRAPRSGCVVGQPTSVITCVG